MRLPGIILGASLFFTFGPAPYAWCQTGSVSPESGSSNGQTIQTRVPHPANIEPLAAQSLLLDIVDTGTRLVAVGARGHILASKDGKEWRQVHSPSRATLTAVDFADPEHGWAVGWDTVILHTSDGGKTWRLQNFDPALQKPLLDVMALDNKDALAVGAYGIILVTHDGGEHWKPVKTQFDREYGWHLNAITRLQDGTLVVVGGRGTLRYSKDAGVTWKAMDSPYSGPFFDAAALGLHGVLIAGLQGQVYCAPEPGKPWHKLDVDTKATFMAATRLSDGRILLAGQGGTTRILPGDTCSTGANVSAPASANEYLSGGVLDPNGNLIAVGKSGLHHLRPSDHADSH